MKQLLALAFFLTACLAPAQPGKFEAVDGHFALNGQPYQIISGEMHYPRVPRAAWRQRFQMARAMGLNTITTYVFWNEHETSPGVYDFSGNNDVREYIREAQQEGLHVILRPGPYVCAEWEFGGYPAWLLKDRSMVIRSSDPRFMQPVRRWFKRLGQELADLQVGNGGPIIAVQVENEYGSFGDDHAYMEQVKQTLLDSGFTKSMLYTADGVDVLQNGSLPELPAVINFGGGDAHAAFEKLHKLRPNGPFMSGEYWAGWFDHWGDKHQVTDADKEAAELAWMLKQGYSVSIYMFHGGTSFGWMNGANSGREHPYEPDTTSYDYDGPLSEDGMPKPKFAMLRNAIVQATGVTPPAMPSLPQVQAIAPFSLSSSASLWEGVGKGTASDKLLTMEDLGQAYGYILYRTELPSSGFGELTIDGLHDYAVVFLDGKRIGTLDRRLQQRALTAQWQKGQRLDILVENSGRINYTSALRDDRKGIVGTVSLANVPLAGWRIVNLPLDHTDQLRFSQAACTAGPCFYRGTFQADPQKDTWLDTSAFHKGFVWVNGHPLGRVWAAGPQHRLFLPASWLKADGNDVTVFDLEGVERPTLAGELSY